MATPRARDGSSSRSRLGFHVFLSGGEDTRWTFADHLYTALVGAGFHTFRDEYDDKIERSKDLAKFDLERAIGESRSSVIVFSRDYVFSSWCLDQLVMILDQFSKRRSSYNYKKLVVIPVFYDLDPSHVRKQKGIVEEAFTKHKAQVEGERDEMKRKYQLEKIEKWRAALAEVADLAGLVLQNQADGYESKFIKIIVQEIANQLDRTVLSVTPYLTGIDSRIKDINLWLQDGSNKVDIMAIYGMGGVGKTTLAKIAYNQNFDRFESSGFVANVREASKQPKGLVRLQKLLLSSIHQNRRKEKIRNVDEGVTKIKDAMCCKRVLVVLDDVDDLDQINAIFSMRDWFYPGSKIMITTRRERILKAHEGCLMYQVKELNDFESLSLFCLHAFGQDHPIEGYGELSRRAVFHCCGLPLALEVLGSSLSCESVDIWENALAKLGTFSNFKIQNVLRVSYDCLDDHDRELFLDIVCFFVGVAKDYTVKILDGCGFHTTVGLQNLVRRCLVAVCEVGNNMLMMHQLLRDMGREIVKQESPKDPGKRSRVWHHKDAFNILKDETGTETIEGLILDLDARKEDMWAKRVKDEEYIKESIDGGSSSKRRRLGLFSRLPINSALREPFSKSDESEFNTDAFSRMRKLRILQIDRVQLRGNYNEFPKKLRWLSWRGFPLTYMSSDFPLENMVVLDFPYSRLRQFWNGTKSLKLMKILNLTRSYSLTSSPDFSKLPNLERLHLKDCINLVEVHDSIGELGRLVLLNLKGCRNLRKLPRKICQLNSLEELNLSGCLKLEELPTDLRRMESLRVFHADGVNLLSSTSGEVKSWHGQLRSWVSKPSKQPELSLTSLPSFVVWLSLADCNISESNFPKDLSGMHLLQGLRLSGNPIRNLPESIRNLSALVELDLQGCTRLQTLPELPMSLKGMSIYGCKSLERATNLPNLLNALILSSVGCVKLDQVQGLFKLEPINNFFDSEMAANLGLSQLESKGALEMKLFNNLTYTARIVQVPQGLYECGIYSTFLPGREVPSWFSSKSTESSISFNVPSLPNHAIWGLKTCVCYSLSLNHLKSNWRHEYIKVSNKTKGSNWIYRSAFIGEPLEGQDLLWLSDWKIGDQLMEGGDEVTVSVNMEEAFQTKEFGVRIAYNEAEEYRETDDQHQSIVSCSSACPKNGGIDLSVYQMNVGEYFLCNHEEFARSQHYSRIAGTVSVETCFCGFQCDKGSLCSDKKF